MSGEAGAATISDENFRAVSATYDAGGLADPYPMYAELRAATPVMEGDILARFGVPSQADYANLGRQVFSVFSHADVSAVLRNDELWTTDLLQDGLGRFLGEMFLTARSGASHRMLRGLLQPTFAPEVTQRWKRELVLPMMERNFGAKLRGAGRMELMREMALPFPIHAIYTILGFPNDPAQAEEFADLALQVLSGPQADPDKAEAAAARAFEAAAAIDERVRAVVAAKRTAGAEGDDMIARLIRAEADGERLDDGQIAGTVRMLLPAAAETTTRTLANLMVILLADESRDVLARVKADRGLIGKAITETMRLEPVAGFLARRAVRDTVLGGVAIPEGAAVSLVNGSANRDEKVFERPDRFEIDRPTRPNMSFGMGAHLCLGMPIARVELEAAANMLLDLPGLRLDADQPPPVIRGLQFRGPDSVYLVWDAE